MSDFDKEAEREKLREKYERDQEKRQSTQRMSELLLKGATMTNRHCEECGDPIFRYDGQEFCPTCQAAQQETSQTGTGTDVEANEGVDAETGVNDGTDVEVSGSDPTVQANGTPESARSDAGETESEARKAAKGAQGGTERLREETRSTGDGATHGDAEPVESEGDLTAARASLIRSVERHARTAEQTDDPRRAKDYLAAAREAAEALSALNR